MRLQGCPRKDFAARQTRPNLVRLNLHPSKNEKKKRKQPPWKNTTVFGGWSDFKRRLYSRVFHSAIWLQTTVNLKTQLNFVYARAVAHKTEPASSGRRHGQKIQPRTGIR